MKSRTSDVSNPYFSCSSPGMRAECPLSPEDREVPRRRRFARFSNDLANCIAPSHLPSLPEASIEPSFDRARSHDEWRCTPAKWGDEPRGENWRHRPGLPGTGLPPNRGLTSIAFDSLGLPSMGLLSLGLPIFGLSNGELGPPIDSVVGRIPGGNPEGAIP
eukprot:scaffold201055_cov29-Tisochrysis_lutea.AAC.16